MDNNKEYFSILALNFLNDKLAAVEKNLVLKLIIDSPEFLKILKEEMIIQRELQVLKQQLPNLVKKRIMLNILDTSTNIIAQDFVSKILEGLLPRVIWPVVQILKRSVVKDVS